MPTPRLPESALWETLHILSIAEKRRLREHIENTRLEWLMDTLLEMKSYAEEKLYKAYKRAFPRSNPELLRSYKRELWTALQDILTRPEVPEIGQEVEVWRHLWLSVILWRRGLTNLAYIHWSQAVHKATQIGWYEVALWALSLLEIYVRDFHKTADAKEVSSWAQTLLGLVRQRYEALIEKLSAKEDYIRTRSAAPLYRLPDLPHIDAWSVYQREATTFLRSAIENDFAHSLEKLTSMIEVLLSEKALPETYRRFRLALACSNLGSALINLRATSVYEQWYHTWTALWQSEYWTPPALYGHIHGIVLGTRFVFLNQTCQWEAARILWDQEQELIRHLLFSESGSIGFRVTVGMVIYLSLLLSEQRYREAIQWRLEMEHLMEKEKFRDYPYLWWHFLRWYEAYRLRDTRWMRYWYRKLWITWKQHFSHEKEWIGVLRIVRAVSSGLPYTQRRRIGRLLEHWSRNPTEQEMWWDQSLFFPMELFWQSLLRRCRLEECSPPPIEKPLRPDLHQRVLALLEKLQSVASPPL